MKDDDYVKFCLKCGWNDSDIGCTSPQGEDVFQCELYRHYHPEEVKEFESTIGGKKVTKVTLEVTDEQLKRLDFIGLLNMNMAGELYDKITISSDEQNDTCDVIDISGAKTVGDMLQIAFPNSYIGHSETEEGQAVDYYMVIDGEEEIIVDPEFWNASYIEKRNSKCQN